MKRFLLLYAFCLSVAAYAAPNITNTVLMVDQHGNLNVEGVASVEQVATNAVKVQIAEAKAEAAQSTAQGVTNALNTVVENIMSNNVVIYRSGFSDSFAPLVVISDSDKLVISSIRQLEANASRVRVALEYVLTANIGSVKPVVMANNTLDRGTQFSEVDAANVTTPVYHAGDVVVAGDTFAGYYSMEVTVPNPASHTSYFFWIKADVDAPSGDGTTLDLPNGYSGDVTWGDRVLTFRGGVLVEVE